ncbi:MAG: L,D-transpeptidase [Chloroflexi bacterium]|nr:L,D-transpeptidase [Chloroflexota bacterium]
MLPQISPSKSFTPLVLILGVALLALVVWTGSLLLAPAVSGSNAATATPTKTPVAQVNGNKTALSFSGKKAPIPTFTPIPSPLPPTATPLPPSASPTPEQSSSVPGWVVELAQKRGINPQGRYIVVDQDNQQMFIIDDGQLLRVLAITTGDPQLGWDTPAWFGVIGDYWGTFRGAGGVQADEGWWLFKRGGNFLIHGLPYILNDQGQKEYKGVDELGETPASRGCIRLAPDEAKWFTAWHPQGVPIIILPYTDPSEVPG